MDLTMMRAMPYMVCLLICVSTVYAGKKPVESLFDLSSDPKEKSDLSNDANYAATMTAMRDKLTSLRQSSTDVKPISTSGKLKAFEKCGGVCPWIEVESSKEKAVSSVHQLTTPPHIVMVVINDWGYNEAGFTSNYMNWASPVLDDLTDKAVTFSNYFTHPSSLPSRGALLTGKYSSRIGLWSSTTSELSSDESTLAEELHNVGYRTYMVGKWGLGMSSSSVTPLNQGFDYFYGHLLDTTDPYTKKVDGYLDLYDGAGLETSQESLSSDLHTAILFQSKVNEVISAHIDKYNDMPMFMYYSIPGLDNLISPITAPSQYLSHCELPSEESIPSSSIRNDVYQYCGLKVMINEVLANLTCALQQSGVDKNLVMIVTSDNGGDNDIMPGVNYPYYGGKGDSSRGGVSVNSIFYDSSLPEKVRGSTYKYLAHVTGRTTYKCNDNIIFLIVIY
jgi:arylsulfatase A-like enzyme